ncbi:MAG: amidohydrolase [Burkholderiaceae bacterium]|nr:amidohydrolase [Burkholderiaceae bacterium]MBP7658872.1 amidohydrolase [Burkholderiaceae bacterium]
MSRLQSTGCGCGLIDVHTHFVPSEFPAYAGAGGASQWPSMAPAQACHRHVMIDSKVYRTVSDQCWDPQVRRADMQRTGVTRQVLSPMPELLSYWLEPRDGAYLCRFLNETLSAFVAADPASFTGLGAVALQDVDAAIRELDHAVHTLGLAGVEIGTNVNGKAIGDRCFEPFFAAAQEWGAAIFVHALRPAGMDRLVGPALLEQVVAFPGEVGLAAASMLTGGTLARHPKLRIAFSHGGGTLRSILPRLQHAWSAFEPLRQLMPESPGELVRRMYYDDLVYDGESIGELLRVFGPTQVMAGTDYPFAIMDREPSARLAALAVDEPTRYALRSGNAKRWLDMT